jgi:hypothetical protein
MIRFTILTLLILSSLTPAWAGQGWYLLKPLFKHNQPPLGLPNQPPRFIETDSSIPLPQWEQEGAFESVEECENKRKMLTKHYGTELKLAEKKNDEAAKIYYNINFSQMIDARCIASDDPRLK